MGKTDENIQAPSKLSEKVAGSRKGSNFQELKNKVHFLDQLKGGRSQKNVAFEANVDVRTVRRCWEKVEAELRKQLEECENPTLLLYTVVWSYYNK